MPKRGGLTTPMLRLDRGERDALRKAGVVAADLAHMDAMEVVSATNDEIDETRAAYLVDVASLLAAGIGTGFSHTLVQRGVRGRADLATRSAESMFLELLDTTARTHPTSYDHLAQVIYLAGTDTPDRELLNIAAWTRRREDRGFDPVLLYWRHRHGDDVALPSRTGERLRLPTLKVSAPIYEGGVDRTGGLVTPLGQKDVVRHAGGPLSLVLGHWMWRGGHGAFARLEDLRAGDGIGIAEGWFAVTSVAKVPAPAVLATQPGAVVLATPPHRRVGIIGTPEMVEPVERDVMQVVVEAEPADAAAVDVEPRPLRRIPGAY